MAEIRVSATGELKLYDSDDSNYVSFKSAGTVSSNVAWVLPSADGSNGQVLTTNGSATLSWATASSADPSSADGDSLGTASAEWSDLYLADGGIIYLGNDQDIKLTHNADKGLIIKHAATADDKPVILTLQTGETDLAANDVIGKLEFQAPDEGTGTDAVLVSGAIQAVAEGDHSSSSNATRLEFMVGASEAAAKKMLLTSAGKLEVDGGIDIEGGAVFNEDSADVDFRVESNGNTHMLFVDAGNNRVHTGAANGGQILNVSGSSTTTYEQALTHAIALAMPGIEIQNSSTTDGNGSCISFMDGGGFINAAIVGVHDDHDTNGDGYLGFCTRTADSGADTANERMRISNAGTVLVNTASQFFGGDIFLVKGKASAEVAGFQVATNGQKGIQFANAGGTDVGNIVVNSSSTAYNTSSDYRLKENVSYTYDATTRLKQLKPARFNWISDDTNTLIDGFLAHEVSSIVPEAVSGTKDELEVYKYYDEIPVGKSLGDNKIDKDGNTIAKHQSIDNSKLVPLLVKTIQELEARIKTLEG